jgi:hypothetical protein
MLSEVEGPFAAMHDEHLRRFVTVLRIDAVRRLASGPDVEPVRFRDMDVLLRVL